MTSNPALREGLTAHLGLITEELNIKRIEFTDKPEEYVSYEVKPNFKALGPKFGKQMKAISAALQSGDSAALHAQLQSGGIQLEIDGATILLGEDDVEIRLKAREGFAAAQGKNMVVVLSTEITEELRNEGWVREFIRGVQDLRKENGLAYDARIAVRFCTASDTLAEVLLSYSEAISCEVLARSLERASEAAPEAKTVSAGDFEVAVAIALWQE